MTFEESAFFDASFSCSADELTICLYGRPVAKVRQVVTAKLETGRNAATGQDLLFLRVDTANAGRAFFIDHEHGRTNVRKISPSLSSLAEALAWLLPPGYATRQGDIAFYAIGHVPPRAQEVTLAQFEDRLLPSIGARHELLETTACAFFVSADRFFLSVAETLRVLHPEHGGLVLPSGSYELVIAKGRSLPERTYVTQARTLLIGM